MRAAGQRVYALIRRMEGLRLDAYKRAGDVWTVGYGHTLGVTRGTSVTADQAERLLAFDVAKAEHYLNAALWKTTLTAGQFDALVDFVFNLGADKFGQSTLHELLLRGDFAAAAAEFPRWIHDSSRSVLPGLIERRKIEREWFTEEAVSVSA